MVKCALESVCVFNDHFISLIKLLDRSLETPEKIKFILSLCGFDVLMKGLKVIAMAPERGSQQQVA